MAKLNASDRKVIAALRRRFPKTVDVIVHRAEEGGFWAEVLSFPGCVTQAETLAELIEMVNDSVVTVLEAPRKYLSFMPTYLPPLSLAQQIGLFPSSHRRTDRTITLSRV